MAPLRSYLRDRPGLLGVLLLIAVLGLAAALGLQASKAATSHQETARAMLRDYAAAAASAYAREARIWLSFGMSQAGGALGGELPGGRRSLPGPELLRRVLAEKDCDCMSAGFAHTAFRVAPGAAQPLLADGAPLAEPTREGLLAAAATALEPREGPRQWWMLAPGQPALARPDDMVLLWSWGSGSGAEAGPGVVYGMIVEAAQIRRPLEGALGEARVLPPSLIGAVPRDSLIRLAVGPASGVPLLATGQPAPGEFVARDTLGSQYGGLEVTAALRPAAAPLLVVGGLPASRLPQILILLALTLLVGTASLVLLRREHQLARLRDDFVSGVSHELRTPLTQIRVLSELLAADGFRKPGERERAVAVIHRESLRLSNLVDNLLQFARLKRAPAPRPERVSLDEVIDEVAETFQTLLAERGDTLETGNLNGIEVSADRDAVATIIRNFLENAIKYGPAGQRIRVTVEAAPGRARLLVDDQGPGVPRADRARIWQPYQRLARDRNSPSGGSGLGLAVVSDLAARHAGRAWVEDAPGGGARFGVELPAPARTPGLEAPGG
jgi:signal transduction histidine kinase